VLEGDISKFFDTIHHGKILEILRERIKDERFLSIIHQMLKIEYWNKEEGNVKPRLRHFGTPQGSILSPILSTIYLDKMDKWIEAWIAKQRLIQLKQTIRTREFKTLELAKRRLLKNPILTTYPEGVSNPCSLFCAFLIRELRKIKLKMRGFLLCTTHSIKRNVVTDVVTWPPFFFIKAPPGPLLLNKKEWGQEVTPPTIFL